jgi:hypothetical protein
LRVRVKTLGDRLFENLGSGKFGVRVKIQKIFDNRQ